MEVIQTIKIPVFKALDLWPDWKLKYDPWQQ